MPVVEVFDEVMLRGRLLVITKATGNKALKQAYQDPLALLPKNTLTDAGTHR